MKDKHTTANGSMEQIDEGALDGVNGGGAINQKGLCDDFVCADCGAQLTSASHMLFVKSIITAYSITHGKACRHTAEGGGTTANCKWCKYYVNSTTCSRNH